MNYNEFVEKLLNLCEDFTNETGLQISKIQMSKNCSRSYDQKKYCYSKPFIDLHLDGRVK